MWKDKVVGQPYHGVTLLNSPGRDARPPTLVKPVEKEALKPPPFLFSFLGAKINL